MTTAASKDKNSPLYRVPPVVDPSNEMAVVLVQALAWNMLSREWNLNVSDLALLHQKGKALLKALKTHLPERVGGDKGWNFERTHSILHKVREIVYVWMGRKYFFPGPSTFSHRPHQECCSSDKQQGWFPLYSSLSLQPWPSSAV